MDRAWCRSAPSSASRGGSDLGSYEAQIQGAVPVRASPRHPKRLQRQRSLRTAPERPWNSPSTIPTTTSPPSGKTQCEPHHRLPAGIEVAVRTSPPSPRRHRGRGARLTGGLPLTCWVWSAVYLPIVTAAKSTTGASRRIGTRRRVVVRVESLHPTRRESWGETRTVGFPVPRNNRNNLLATCPASLQPRTVLLALRPVCVLPWRAWRYQLWGTTVQRTDEIFYTLARLNADPVASDLAPAFASRLDEFRTLAANEITLTEARLQAQAAVDQADGILDGFVDEFAAVLLIDVNKDRKRNAMMMHAASGA